MTITLRDGSGVVIGEYTVTEATHTYGMNGIGIQLSAVQIPQRPQQGATPNIGFHKTYTSPVMSGPVVHPKESVPKIRRVRDPMELEEVHERTN
jgi:hypothetical protein